MTNARLVEFVKGLPVTDKRTALRSVVVYDRSDHNPDNFLFTLFGVIDWSRKRPVPFLTELSLLYDGSASVAQAGYIALRYLATLFADPQTLWEGYSVNCFLDDFIRFLCSEQCTDQWLVQFDGILCWSLDDVALGLNSVLGILVNKFKFERFETCVVPLMHINKFLSLKAAQRAFLRDQLFIDTTTALFGHGLFPTTEDMSPDSHYTEVYGQAPMDTMTRTIIDKADNMHKRYHHFLTDILMKFMRTDSRAVCNFISHVMKKTHPSDNARVSRTSTLLAGNLEAVLIRIVIGRSQEIKPLTPYLKDAMDFFYGGEGPLAVPGIKSWVSKDNARRMGAFHRDDEIDTAADAEWQQILAANQETKPDLYSQLFFAAVVMLNNHGCRCISHFENLARQIGHIVNPVQKALLRNLLSYYRFAYSLPSRRDDLRRFLQIACDVMLRVGQYSDSERKFVAEKPNVVYQRLPEALGQVVSHMASFLMSLHEMPEPKPFVGRLGALFANRHYLPNPNMRKRIVDFFVHIARQSEFSHLIMMETVLQQVYPAVVEFYSDVQMTGTSTQYYERDGIRRMCVKLLRFWLAFDEPKAYFKKTCTKEENRVFLYYLVSDVTTFITSLCDAFGYLTGGEEDFDAKEAIRYNGRMGKKWLRLIDFIAEFAPEAFDEDRVAKAVPTLVISYFSRFRRSEAMHNNEPWETASMNKYFFLVEIARLATRFRNLESITKNMVNESLSYTENLFEGAREWISQAPELSSDFLAGYDDFVMKANSYKGHAEVDEYQDINVDWLDIPEEFQDIIMHDFIRDPWTLPTGTNVDKETLEYLKVTGCQDPMTQEVFRPEDARPNPEVKARIQQWIAELRSKQ